MGSRKFLKFTMCAIPRTTHPPQRNRISRMESTVQKVDFRGIIFDDGTNSRILNYTICAPSHAPRTQYNGLGDVYSTVPYWFASPPHLPLLLLSLLPLKPLLRNLPPPLRIIIPRLPQLLRRPSPRLRRRRILPLLSFLITGRESSFEIIHSSPQYAFIWRSIDGCRPVDCP